MDYICTGGFVLNCAQPSRLVVCKTWFYLFVLQFGWQPKKDSKKSAKTFSTQKGKGEVEGGQKVEGKRSWH